MEDQQHWEQYVEKQFRRYVHIIPAMKSATDLEHSIRESALANIRGHPIGLMLYYV